MDFYDDAFKVEELKSKFQIYSEHITSLINKSPILYQHQKDAISQVKKIKDEDDEKYKTEPTKIEPIIVVAPPGSGKSAIIFFLPYILKSARVLIITPSKLISNQLAKTFGIEFNNSFLESVGLCPSDDDQRKKYLLKVLEPGKIIRSPKEIAGFHQNLIITNAQKFSGSGIKYENKIIIPEIEHFFAQFDTLIVDEAHHYPANTWMNIVEMFKKYGDKDNKKMIFITVTPYRNIGGKMEFILGPDMMSRIAYWIKPADLEGKLVRKFNFIELNHDGRPENVMRDIMRVFNKHSKREPRVNPQAMILVKTRNEALNLSKELNDQVGIQDFAVSLSNGDNSVIKSKQFTRFTEGKIQVAVTCGVGLEGYDNSNIILCIILRKMTSNILFEQFVGRCTQMKRGLQGEPDKSIGVVLSYREYNVKKLFDERSCIPDCEDDTFVVDDDDDDDDK